MPGNYLGPTNLSDFYETAHGIIPRGDASTPTDLKQTSIEV
jgi:hypothetical protein